MSWPPAAQRLADCKARPYGSVVQCTRCGIGWHIHDRAPPECLPTVKFRIMRCAADHAQRYFAAVQRRNLRKGKPFRADDANFMAAYAAIQRLIDRILGDPVILDRLKTPGGNNHPKERPITGAIGGTDP